MSHPVRRRIVMALMVVGSAGLVTAVAGLLGGFLSAARDEAGAVRRLPGRRRWFLDAAAQDVGRFSAGGAASSWSGIRMGGITTALLCAAERPDLVERLVLIDIGPDSLTSEGDVVHMLAASAASCGTRRPNGACGRR